MRNTSELYKALREETGSFYEVRVTCGENIYTDARLKEAKLYPALFDGSGPKIGQTYSAECDLVVLEQSMNWPRMAKFAVETRISSADEARKSEWLSMGTFYTDQRAKTEGGALRIIGFDGMLLLEQSWTDKIPGADMPARWPITSKAMAELLVQVTGVPLDERTVLDDTVACWGLDTTSTARERWADIAAAHGGNFIITPEGKLRIVPLVKSGVPMDCAVAGIALVGVAVVGTSGMSNLPGADFIPMGMRCSKLTTSPKLEAISGVILETEAGTQTQAGDGSGYTVSGTCNFADSGGVAALCLSKVQGFEYQPFEAAKAVLDPAAEPGDLVGIPGGICQIMSLKWNLGRHPRADISAPYEAEVDHEFTIQSDSAKTLKKALQANADLERRTFTAIEQTASQITLSASQTYVSFADYDQAIQDLQNQIDGTISSYSGDVLPTLANYPASEWTTESQKQQHIGALYLVTSDSGSEMAGQYYRFEQSGSTFRWVLVEDSALARALADAAAAQAAAAQAIADAETAQAAADAAQGTADEAALAAAAEAAAAKAAAIAEAAADATRKANEALEAAKGYVTTQLTNFINGEYADDLKALKGQVDRKAETYYQANDPSLSWGNGDDHTGDLWYSMGDQLYFRWNGSAWEELTANPPSAVFDTLDGKAKVFVATPEPPYQVGDLWVQGESGDILRCMFPKTATQSYDRGDWILASKYTDDSSLEAFLTGTFAETLKSIQAQLDGKAESYYQADDPALSNGKSRWDAVAGRAVADVAIVGSTLEVHEGDIWYRTTDDTSWYWDGTKWVEQTISRELFDTIDGKAQIFVRQPVPPYDVGDLWVQGESGDILRCIVGRDAGSYTPADWELASKYTDDTAANTVQSDLNLYKDTISATLTEYHNRIEAKVAHTYGRDGTVKSFSWALTESAHTWYADNKEVLRIDKDGLDVKGRIAALSGYIGNNSAGFTIGASSIYNGMTSLYDSSHSGIYIGTDGIALGSGNFKVTSGGTLTANNATLTGTLTVGGEMISAAALRQGAMQAFNGYQGWNTAAGYANLYNDATKQNSNAYPDFFHAKYITAHADFYSPAYHVNTGNDSSEYNLAGHYHRITPNNDGTVTIGGPYNANSPPSFNIADTKFYKDGVSARTASSVRFGIYDDNGSTDYGHVVVSSSDGNTSYLSISPNGYMEGWSVGYERGKASVAAVDKVTITAEISSNGRYFIMTAKALDASGNVLSEKTGYTPNTAYTNGVNSVDTAAWRQTGRNDVINNTTISMWQDDATSGLYGTRQRKVWAQAKYGSTVMATASSTVNYVGTP